MDFRYYNTPAHIYPDEKDILCLTVGLGNTLNLILLLDGITVGGTSGSVDDLVRQALSNGLDVAEGRFTRTSGHEVDGEVNSSEGGHIHSLSADDTGSADTGGVLARAGVDDGIDKHLDGVLIGQDVDQFQGVLDNAHSHQLLAVVAAAAHQRACQTLNNGALEKNTRKNHCESNYHNMQEHRPYLSLSKSLALVSAGGVGDEGGVLSLDGNVVLFTTQHKLSQVRLNILPSSLATHDKMHFYAKDNMLHANRNQQTPQNPQFIEPTNFRSSLDRHTQFSQTKATYHEGDVGDLDILEAPFAKKLDFSGGLSRHVVICVHSKASSSHSKPTN